MKKILIVDDEPMIRELLAEYFRLELKVESITFASDGFDAFAEASLQKFDLICLDQMMPFCKGDQFLTALRKKEGPNKTTTVVMVSAYIPDITSEIKSIENTYFLEKPIDYERLSRYAKIAFNKEFAKKVA